MGAITKGDTFVEGADQLLTSHTPTGTNAGTGWGLIVAGGSITVNAAADAIKESSFSNGNRHYMTDDLGNDVMDVQADFVSTAPTGLGNFASCGVVGRVSGAGGTYVEFYFDHGNNNWIIGGFPSGIPAVPGTWPGGTVTMRLECRNGSFAGYANGVLKISGSANYGVGNRRAGIMLLNFDGGGPYFTVDNFVATGYTPDAPAAWLGSF